MADAPEPLFLDDRLAHWAQVKPDEVAMVYLGRSFTWAEFDNRVRRLAGALAARGIGRGDVVAFLDKNHPACVETTMAAASLGAATAIINFRLAGDEIDYVINDCGAKLLIVGADLRALIDKIRDDLTAVEHVIEVTPEGGDGDEYEAMLAAATPRGRGADVTPQDVCVIMYSSGTTGNPKGIRLTQANLIAHTMNAGSIEFLDDDKNMVSMPLFHVGGSSYAQGGIHAGITSLMTREVDGASLVGAMLAGATRTFLVPAVLAKVMEMGPDAIKLFNQLRTSDAARSASPGAHRVPRHRFHPGVRTDRGVRGHHPALRRGAPRRVALRAHDECRAAGARCGGAGGQSRHPRGRSHRRCR
jgi:acyl-CoA synthetase (AMP-forming)/AMP-acid ligase II